MIRQILVAAASLTLSGCVTQLSTTRDTVRSDYDQALNGASYALPMIQYDVKVAYKVAGCPVFNRATNQYDGDVTLKIETTPTSSYVAGERFHIDYRALTSLLKTTDFTLETHDTGTLKAINATAEDKSGDVIKSLVDTAISAASIGAGSPFAAAAANDKAEAEADRLLQQAVVNAGRLLCTDATAQMIADRKIKMDRVETITGLLKANTKAADLIGVRANLKLSQKGDRPALLKLHRDQISLGEELSTLQDAMNEIDKKLSFEDRWTWPIDPKSAASKQPMSSRGQAWAEELFDIQLSARAIDPTILRTLIAGVQDPAVKALLEARLKDLPPVCLSADLGPCLANYVQVYASLETDQTPARPCTTPAAGSHTAAWRAQYDACPATDSDDALADDGVFVREPIRSRLVLCDLATPCYRTTRKPLYEGPLTTTPQFGQLRFIRMKNGPFQNNALGLSLAKDGTIEKLQYGEKSAVAATALASISSAASKIDGYQAKLADQREQEAKDAKDAIKAARTDAADIRNDKVAELQAQIDMIAKQKQLTGLQSPTNPVVEQEYLDRTTRLKAELEYLNTEIALREAETKLAQK